MVREEVASFLTKGAIQLVPEIQFQGGLFLNLFIVPKKDGKVRPVLKPQGIEPVCGDKPLQDGGNSYPQRSINPERLDDKNRPQGCLFHSPNKRES